MRPEIRLGSLHENGPALPSVSMGEGPIPRVGEWLRISLDGQLHLFEVASVTHVYGGVVCGTVKLNFIQIMVK